MRRRFVPEPKDCHIPFPAFPPAAHEAALREPNRGPATHASKALTQRPPTSSVCSLRRRPAPAEPQRANRPTQA